MNTGNIGRSHGYCKRHYLKAFSDNDLPLPTKLPSSFATDLSTLSPEELQIASELYNKTLGEQQLSEGDLECSVCKKVLKTNVIDGPHNTSTICPNCKGDFLKRAKAELAAMNAGR